MPIRNPFTRRPGAVPQDENLHPTENGAPPSFERVDTVGSKASSVLSMRSSKSQDNGEYKMSVVNDSGVYLPPSPTEKESAWPRKYLSRNSSDSRPSFGDIEHFSISRESFDTYRRSFDVSARSPVPNGGDAPMRQSLDSARFQRFPRSAIDRHVERQPPTAEEGFEDVGLDDQKLHPRRRGFFSKFSDGQEKESAGTQSGSMSRFLSGRKRGQSGQGSELGNIDQTRAGATMEDREMQ